ncbi:hypothetical protein [Candidatus Nitrotoga sp. AM1P]|uniref:hypothetical protein n=1 Tax=Candidatus Nitrotoga sp. AM1P TaxID=2559597 RepID=UPI0010B46738|nr:hypothetical protein [Candidatus Nitrotoga sp. AM1P]BBJ23885.1 hypothetical protein W01_18120 [Candidatus Nitrotoga sp. AM1P]
MHQGRYPLYGVTARIVDLAEFQTALKSGNPYAADTIVPVGEIAQNQAILLHKIDLGVGTARDFNVFFTARNGDFTQLVRFRRVNGKWCQATSVTATISGDATLFLRVNDGYPINIDGKPDGL